MLENKTQIICLRSDAFYALIDACLEHIDAKFNLSKESPWLDTEETLKLLNISSRTTLQKLRDEGKIKFSQPSKKIILFERKSLLEYLESHSQNVF
jgi:hypothetical protein